MFRLIVRYSDKVVMEFYETMAALMAMACRHSEFGAVSFQVAHDD